MRTRPHRKPLHTIEPIEWASQLGGRGDLSFPYYNVREETPEYPGAAWLDRIEATPAERAAVAEAVERIMAFEGKLAERVRRKEGKKQGDVFAYEESPAYALEQLGVGWRREVSLMNAVLRLARERGAVFGYRKHSAWGKRILAEAI
jgi:hypothetical protein